jgi:hypothetical protein
MPDLPINIAVAPFPEGFSGDMDETFQQAAQNTTATVQGNFIQGQVLPPGSTLPTSDQGPIAMGGTWYFWDPTTGSYQQQSVALKVAKNFARNGSYQVAQLGNNYTVASGIAPTYDMAQVRATGANVLAISLDTGPAASIDNDTILSSMKYTVGPTLVPTLGATDIYAHEHLIEGSDIAMLQAGQVLSVSFSIFATVGGTYSVYLTNNGRDRSYVANFTITSGQVGSWIRIKIGAIPAFPITGGTWNFGDGVTGLYIGIPMGVGSQWQTSALGSWQSGFFAGSAQNINMLTAVNNQLKISGIKLEAATSPTYYQGLSFGAAYEECIRYYYTTFDYQSTNSGVPMTFVAQAAGGAAGSWGFPRRMCRAPTVVPYSTTTFAAGNLRNLTTNADVALANLSASAKGAYLNTTTGGGAKGDVLAALIRADARLG